MAAPSLPLHPNHGSESPWEGIYYSTAGIFFPFICSLRVCLWGNLFAELALDMVLGTYWEHIGEMSCAGWLLWDREAAQPFSCFVRESCHPYLHAPLPLCTALLTCTPAPRAVPHVQPGTTGPTSHQHSALILAFCGVIFHLNCFFSPDPEVLQV